MTLTSREINKVHYLKFIFCFILLIPILTSCESRRTIVSALNQSETNEILVVLSRYGIDARKVQMADGGGGGGNKEILWEISVPDVDAIRSMEILSKSGLPRKKAETLLNIFKDVGLVPSELQEQIRYQEGQAAQIASIIRKFDGVLDAEARISWPKEDPLNPKAEKKEKITASVYVKHNGVLDDPNSHLITKIKRLVSSSVNGLDYDNVTIIPERSRFSDQLTTGAGGEEEKEYLRIWTIVVAKESATKFRIIFFSMILIILLLSLMMSWFGWKISPLLSEHGGLKSLFTLKPFEEPHPKENEMNEEETAQEEEKDDDESQQNKDVT